MISFLLTMVFGFFIIMFWCFIGFIIVLTIEDFLDSLSETWEFIFKLILIGPMYIPYKIIDALEGEN